jgi:hypothetical protein
MQHLHRILCSLLVLPLVGSSSPTAYRRRVSTQNG